VLVQSGQALSGLEGLFHPPSGPGDADQRGQGYRIGRPAAVVGEFTGGAVAADQQPVAAGPGFGQVDSSPSTKSLTRRRGSTRANRPAIRPIKTSNASCQWAGSTLRPAATA
jgi:hypothetical protein